MVRVRGVGIARQYGMNFRAACQCMLLGFDQQRASAFADNKTVPLCVERTAGGFGVVVAAGEGLGL